MSEAASQFLIQSDPASASAAAALEEDPFYRSICAPNWSDPTTRRSTLSRYFDYSIREGHELGRSVHLADEALGVAVWLLPANPEIKSKANRQKRAFLENTLGGEGCTNYYRILQFMSAKSAALIHDAAWYLSIIAVDPVLQGQGFGRKLLEPTIEEADRAHATCYLETFGERNRNFYQRLGFAAAAQFTEPTTGADYTLMIRPPDLRR